MREGGGRWRRERQHTGCRTERGGVREGGRDREGSAELRARQTAYSQHIMAIIRQRGEVDRGGLREKRREEEEEGGRRE